MASFQIELTAQDGWRLNTLLDVADLDEARRVLAVVIAAHARVTVTEALFSLPWANVFTDNFAADVSVNTIGKKTASYTVFITQR